MATRSRYRLFMVKEKLRVIEEIENIGNRTAGRKYDVKKVIFVTGAKKTNCGLQRGIVIVGHFVARK